VFDHLRGNLIAADLMSRGPAPSALAAAEETFPVLEPVAAFDSSPLARPPVLAGVPRPAPSRPAASAMGLAVALAALGLGTTVMWQGRR
jgi:nitrous oxidase accessory protein